MSSKHLHFFSAILYAKYFRFLPPQKVLQIFLSGLFFFSGAPFGGSSIYRMPSLISHVVVVFDVLEDVEEMVGAAGFVVVVEDTVAVALVKVVLVVGFKDWVVDDVAER